MHTFASPAPVPMRSRPPVTPPLQLTVIENETGRRVCSFPSRIDVARDTQHWEFEDEAWGRAVLAQRVEPDARHLYSIELR